MNRRASMDIAGLRHHHSFRENKERIEKKTLVVVLITVSMMGAEIVFGLLANSMALFADGVHMGTHALALGVTLLAYILARKLSHNRSFVFGTWKIEILGAYTSALILGVVAIIMAYTSIERLLNPVAIRYDEALVVACIGLAVNVICAFILNTARTAHHHHGEHRHHSGHEHDHDHDERSHVHKDINLRSAYLHVVADALTSVFAIVALISAKYFDFVFLDPIMGIAGSILILRWAFFLLRDSSKILLDYDTNPALADKIKASIEGDGSASITDLHLWKVSDHSYSAIIALVTNEKYSTEEYKNRLRSLEELAHVTVEVN
jgi:cation diffusion facilitator family transporter